MSESRGGHRWEFDEAVTVKRVGVGLYRGLVRSGWEVGDVTNGGYAMSIALQAALEELGLPDPLTVTAHFLRPAEPGTCELSIELLRRGRRHGTVAVAMRQHDRDILRVLTTCGDLAAAEGPSSTLLAPPDLPAPNRCPTLEEAGQFIERPISQYLEMRFDPALVRFVDGLPTGAGELAGWIRFSDGRPPDVTCAPVFLDAFPPSSANLDLDVVRAPTLELTVHVRERPAAGWLREVVRTPVVLGGYLVEDGELWDESGTLVAQSRQLALAPRS